jgi:hypothetical protein
MLEVSVARKLFHLLGRHSFQFGVALWQGGLPVDLLPAQGTLEVHLGGETFAWPIETPV